MVSTGSPTLFARAGRSTRSKLSGTLPASSSSSRAKTPASPLSRRLPAYDYGSDQRGSHAEIAIVSRESWQKTGAFADQKGHTGVSSRNALTSAQTSGISRDLGSVILQRVSAIAFSANGLYLASAAADESDILIWSVKDRSIVARTPHSHGLITSLAFHPAPGANSLAYIDNKGQLTRWQGPVPDKLAPPANARAPPPAKAVDSNHAAAGGSTKAVESGGKGKAGAAGGRKRSDSASTSTSSRAGGGTGGGGGNLFRKEEASEDEYDDPEFDNALEGWIDDDLAADGAFGADGGDLDLDADDAANEFPDDVPLLSRSAGTRAEGGSGARSRSVLPRDKYASGGSAFGPREKGQAPFQVGATPWREQRRYLGACLSCLLMSGSSPSAGKSVDEALGMCERPDSLQHDRLHLRRPAGRGPSCHDRVP